ncbi:bifunctional serine/threonine-protein kinase/transporter substrate-binding domain-containing protein [Arthrobacter sp. SLBN-53]|uniref:bifunctional serine/threonine-protein kinase/transporter substrate-binding domain-containing protein n=1 Tax=Arthrobacter sp. SLBN-53 TaxID=2768412 RepID=UPI00114DCB5C|nr:bifunctional serine/threonine-protein kinase/transporter substrate-binding domain-containing protein [Arthrobacter sp. SLBN-53]TQK30561.1 serine/threonine protein kinase with extracellular ligand sensor [Arthrobacter sp. SLBN-53]
MDSTPFGHYQLRGLIGRGGMGEVYRAYDTKTDRVVALKVLPPQMAQDKVFQQRFRRESQAAAGVNDPHVVPIHGFGEIDGRLYLDMRLIEGRTLGELLSETGKPLDPTFAVKVVEQIASALDAAHQQGLIHRDIKPSNILLTKSNFAYLIDFGLARTAGETGMTTAGSTLGTLAYMAPERFDGGYADARADTYALTCVLYECLTGARPYPADSLEQQIAGHMVSPTPKPSETNPRLAPFDEVIATGMAKKPEKRYQTGAELAAAATRALRAPVRITGSGRHTARRRAPQSRRTPRRALVLAGVLVLVGAGVVGVWKWQETRDAGQWPEGAVPAIAAAVPADVRAAGTLVIGVNVPYAPNEFTNSDGEIVGFDVDLMDAVARTMGLGTEYRESEFDDIIPAVQAGTVDVGMSSVTDTVARQKLVDFVTYFQAGTLWAQRAGSSVDPTAACGLRVGVAHSVIQETAEIPAKSDECVAAGLAPIEKVVFGRQDDVTAALIAGDIDAMSADSPVAGFAIKLSGGALVPAGEVFDSAPYGWPVAKGSELARPLLQAVNHLIGTGEYRTIATMWGVERGMITEPVINGAAR